MDLLQTAERMLAQSGIRVDLNTFIALFGLAFARVVTAIYFAPFFGGQSVPARVRVGLAFMLAAMLAPNLARGGNVQLSPLLMVALLAKEVLVGMLGIVFQFVFYGIQMAGDLIDTQRGMNQFLLRAPARGTGLRPGPSSSSKPRSSSSSAERPPDVHPRARFEFRANCRSSASPNCRLASPNSGTRRAAERQCAGDRDQMAAPVLSRCEVDIAFGSSGGWPPAFRSTRKASP